MCGKSPMPPSAEVQRSLGDLVVDFAETHLDIELTDWQRRWLDKVYEAPPPPTE